MMKILGGLIAAIVIAVGGFFGFQFYTQHRIAGEIDTALEQIRSAGGKASHGKVSFDLLSRTVTIADIAAESAAQPPVSVKVASLTASGVSQPDTARVSANSIEISDVEIGVAMAPQPALSLAYKVPRITVRDYSGPASLQRPASASLVDIYRSALEQFAGMTASSITVASIVATFKQGAATPVGAEVAYSGVAIQGVKDGKIASTRVDSVVFTASTQPAGKPEKVTGNLANIAGYEIDTHAIAAILDPQKVGDDQYYRSYRQITAGPYVVTSGQGPLMRIDSLTIDDVGLQPSRMQLPDLLAMIPAAGAAPPTAAQARALLEKVARIYEGIRIGNVEMRSFALETPGGPAKVSAIRFNLDSGKINEFAIEGVDGPTPQGPFKVARFALKSLDIANLLRMSALLANPAQPPSPDKALDLIPLIGGIELKGFIAPYKSTGKPINVENFGLDWGQFVGPIPSKVQLALKMSAPLDASDPGQKVFVAAGLDKAAIELDLGAAWTEASRAFALEPVTLDIAGVAKVSARVSLANVPRGAFTSSAVQAGVMAAQIEAGTIEFTLRDAGGIDLLIAQQARSQNLSRDAARQAIVDGIRSGKEQSAAGNSDAAAAVEAVARFVETPGQTLNIKLTPLGKVPAMQLVQLLKNDPFAALAQFRIEASTGL
jgi:hypothetical protein